MTIDDGSTGRKLAKPVEEVGKALAAQIEIDWDDNKRGFGIRKDRLAEAAINRLRKLGFINDIGLEAIKAETNEAGK